MPGPLLILGASARAAAGSAIRAGFEPIAVDLFADLDLARACPAHRVEPSAYPDGLARLAAGLPPAPWIYTGGLENHPELLDRIAADRPIWGNPGAVVRRARDPVALAEALRSAGLPAFDVRLDAGGLPRDGSWLVKPLRSAGGARIRPFVRGGPEPGPGDYLQRRAPGPSGSAVFLADDASARLVGVTRQWIGHDAAPFGYLGSVGPVRVPEAVRRQLRRAGEVLAGAIGLRGLFGVDFVLDGPVAWPVEVNPRYTASVEVLEWASGRPLLRDHASCFGAGPGGDGHGPCRLRVHQGVGKLIVYATADGVVPRSIRWPLDDRGTAAPPRLADLPAPGTPFRAGQPVLTLLEAGPSAGECRRRLARRLGPWRARLRRWGDEGGRREPSGGRRA